MSLMDTIKGARQEIDENGALDNGIVGRMKRDEDKDAGTASSSQKFTRRSASKARPSRKQAEGVRVVNASGKSKSKKPKTKEEAKAERRHDREVDDLRYNVSQKILKEREDYQKSRKMWWKFLIVGVVLMVISIGLYMYVSRMGSAAPDWLGIIGLFAMAAAYVVVIAGIIYDWRVIRPMRKDIDTYVHSMSEKRLIKTMGKDAQKSDNKSTVATKDDNTAMGKIKGLFSRK